METTLARKKSDFESRVGVIAGYGDGEESAWNAKTTAIIRDCVKSGYHRFIYCGYPWSFLKPFVSLTLKENANTIPFPDDCGGIEGRVVVTNPAATTYTPLNLIAPERIELLHAQNSDQEGTPQAISLRAVKGTTAARGSVQELYVYPNADDDYTLRVQCYLRPNSLDDTHPYAYGGVEHAETILESCLAIWEERYKEVINGPHALAFQRMLQQSMTIDARNKPQHLGKIASDDDSLEVTMARGFPTVYINGIEYGE